MYFLQRKQTDPFCNLAAEEYLLRNGPDDMFMLWQNEPCVVIGKHQNAYAEINYHYCRDKKIPVIRRISGGGAVYHDFGNINFTFIRTVGKENAIDFSRFLKPMMDTFAKLGLEVTTGKRNDLYINGQKFSGNAEHVYRLKVLHHGTILFDTDLEALDMALSPSGKTYTDKAVKSVRSAVANLKPYLTGIETTQEFILQLVEAAKRSFQEFNLFELSNNDLQRIENLAEEKYSTWRWNYGYSPEYHFTAPFLVHGRNIDFNLTVRNGNIIGFEPVEPLKSQGLELVLQSCFIEQPFEEQSLRSIIQTSRNNLNEAGFDTDTIINSFF